MNNEFDFNRFGKVFIKDLKNIWPRFGLTLLIIMLLPTAIWIIFNHGRTIDPVIRLSIIINCMTLASIMAPSRLYKYCNIPNYGIHFAMLPASKKEKFWSMVLMTAVVVPLIAFLGMALLDLFQHIILKNDCPWLFPDFLLEETILWFFLFFSLCAINATFFFTATLFKKHKIVQTVLWAMLIGFVLVPVMSMLSVGLLNRIGNDLSHIIELISSDSFSVYAYLGYIVFMIIWAVGFYYGAYYRLKRMKY